MTSLIQADIFFFISSIAFVILGILAVIVLVYVIKVLHSFMRILERVEESMDSIGDATMELIDEMRDNMFFRMLFPAKKKPRIHKPKDLPK